MDPATVLMIVQLVTALEPATIGLINKLVDSFQNKSGGDETVVATELRKLEELATSLKPMQPKA